MLTLYLNAALRNICQIEFVALHTKQNDVRTKRFRLQLNCKTLQNHGRLMHKVGIQNKTGQPTLKQNEMGDGSNGPMLHTHRKAGIC